LFHTSKDSNDWSIVTNWTTVQNTTTQSEWKNNNFAHSDMVKSKLRVTNGALNEVIKETDGFVIDLTAPVVEYINDGEEAEQDIKYQV
jgi:hypothetical protein